MAPGHRISASTLSCWRLDETTAAATATDACGHMHLPTGGGSPTVIAGRVTSSTGLGARRIGGAGIGFRAYAIPSDATALRGAISVGAWVRITALTATSQYILGVGGPTESEADNILVLLYVTNAGRLWVLWEYGAGVNETAPGAVVYQPIGPWTHVAFTRSIAGACKIYVNGVVMASGTSTHMPTGGDGANVRWMLGNDAASLSAPLNGDIDDAWVETREMSNEEIAAEFERSAYVRVGGINLDTYLAPSATGRQAPDWMGERRRAFSGGLRTDGIGYKGRLRLRTVPLAQSDAQAIRGLVEGRGETFPFDSEMWSAQGLPPTVEAGTITAARQKWGAGSLSVYGQHTYTLGSDYTGPWTALAWYYNTSQTTAAWEHWLIRSDGVKYKNGTASAAGTGWLTIPSGVLTLDTLETALAATSYPYAVGEGPALVGEYVYAEVAGVWYFYACTASGSPAAFAGDGVPAAGYASTFNDSAGYTFSNVGELYSTIDDVVVVPYLVPTAWATDIYTAHAMRAWPALPSLRASGDMVPDPPRTLRGADSGSSIVPHIRTTLQVNGEVLEAELSDA